MTIRRAILGVINLALIAMLGMYITSSPEGIPKPAPSARGEVTGALVTAEQAASAANVSLPGRPLFRADPVHSPTAKKSESIASPQEGPSFWLVGIVHGQEEQVAVIMKPQGESFHRLRVGQEHSGWRLVQLTARAATFKREGNLVRMNLAVSRKSAGSMLRNRADRTKQ